MTGPEHYAEAVSCLDVAETAYANEDRDHADYWQQRAQVHATLALADAVRQAPATVGHAINSTVRKSPRQAAKP